ncbi:MAG TPA: MarR family transcriptional regulator [Rhizomicrobium sp.]|nr:MarR family transcriptional regulator [Rhizomicrobium sp.]
MSQPNTQYPEGTKAAAKKISRKGEASRVHNSDTQYTRLGFLIHDVSRLRRNAFDRLMRPLGVTRSQWWVLAHVSRHDGLMQTELAELLDVGKVTLGGLIDRLEVGGWVVRRPDKGDRRVKRIFLTSRTDQLFKQMHAAEAQLKNDLLKGISSTECDHLFSILSRMKHNLVKFGASAADGDAED